MENDKSNQRDELIEVLIQLAQNEPHKIETVLKEIEEAKGQIFHVYSPYLIIARVPNAFIAALKKNSLVNSVDTEAIVGERLESASEIYRLAFLAWNEYLQKKLAETSKQNHTLLTWDAPGRLPPDPPPHLREILRRREEEEKKKDSDLP